MTMNEYIVRFSGFAAIKANSEEEAREKFFDDDWYLMETEIDEIEDRGEE